MRKLRGRSLAAGVMGAGALFPLFFAAPAGAAAGVINLMPSPPAAGYGDQSVVTVSFGPNSTFPSGAGIKVLECADLGGSAVNLPSSDASCDGNTVQGNSVTVAGDGSFSVAGYTVYLLPSTALAEAPNQQPVCDTTHACVLFVGTNQNDFTQPHVFSSPFFVNGSAAPTTTAALPGSTTTSTLVAATTSTTTASTTSTSASTTSSIPVAGFSAGLSTYSSGSSSGGGSSLAYTGASPALGWFLAAGAALTGLGIAGKRAVTARRKAVERQAWTHRDDPRGN